MNLGRRYGGAWIWGLTLALAACGGGGGDGSDDKDAGDASMWDGSIPDGGGMDASDPGDSGLDAGPDGAGPDAGGDAQADAEIDADGGGCEGKRVDQAGGVVESDDGLLRFTVEAGALDQAVMISLCPVEQGARPQAVVDDKPLGTVYALEVEGEVPGRLSLELTSDQVAQLTLGDDAVAPVILRRQKADDSLESLSDLQMELSNPVRVSGQAAGSGLVYLRHLDSDGGRYGIQLTAPQAQHITGEVFPFAASVTQVGAPADTRALALDFAGCDVEPIQPEGKSQTSDSTPECPALESLTYEAEGEIDLTGASAPLFFCKFPGEGWVRTVVRFERDAETELSISKQQVIQCTLSTDLVVAYDIQGVVAAGSGVAPDGEFSAQTSAIFASDDWLGRVEPFGGDGIYSRNPDPNLQSKLSVRAADPITAGTDPDAGVTNNFVQMEYASDPDSGGPEVGFYVPTDARRFLTDDAGIPIFYDPFFGGAAGTMTFAFGAGGALGTRGISSSAVSALGLSFGEPAGPATTLSFDDGLVDAVWVLAAEGTGAFVAHRWIRPSDLPLDGGRRTLSLLSAAQRQLVEEAEAQAASIHYLVGFLHVDWDEARGLWSGGRVVPVATGSALEIPGALVEP